MCGRARLAAEPEDIAELLGVAVGALPTIPRKQEINPDDAMVVMAGGRVSTMRYGFHGRDALVFNARSETAFDRVLFQEAMHERRCIVVIDGFFEWDAARRKQLLATADAAPFALAGLYDPEQERCVVLTQPARPPVKAAHGRMPVFLPRTAFAAWLAGDGGVAHDVLDEARTYTPPLVVRDVSKQLSLFGT